MSIPGSPPGSFIPRRIDSDCFAFGRRAAICGDTCEFTGNDGAGLAGFNFEEMCGVADLAAPMGKEVVGICGAEATGTLDGGRGGRGFSFLVWRDLLRCSSWICCCCCSMVGACASCGVAFGLMAEVEELTSLLLLLLRMLSLFGVDESEETDVVVVVVVVDVVVDGDTPAPAAA